MDSYAQAIYTRKGITDVNVFTRGEKVLHLGSGSRPLPGSVTVDILALPGVDVVHDLDIYPWPYADASFDVVYAHNVVEHITDSVRAMEEIWRVLKPGGRVVITVPYFRSVDAFSDLTHKHFFTSQSMNTFIANDAKYQYTQKVFKRIGFWYGWPHASRNVLVRAVKSFMHTHTQLYDSHLSLLIPTDIVIWELEKIA